jgi:hypothetical protein
MWVKCLDIKIRKFLTYSLLILIILAALTGFLYFSYKNFTLSAYNAILLVLIFIFAALIVFVACIFISVYLAYRSKRVNRFTTAFAKAGIRLVIPAAIMLAGLFKKDKEAIRSFFIDINNIIIKSREKRYKPEEILVILPHCLQYSGCERKITNNIWNCVRCGRCNIGTILEIVSQRGVEAAVVTGGTAARNLALRVRPKILIAVACERDLESGIHDAGAIPVVGLVNERPFGPCFNTTVNVEALQSELDRLLCKDRANERGIPQKEGKASNDG